MGSGDDRLQQGTVDRRGVRVRAIPTLFLDEVDELSQTGREPLDQGDTPIGSVERDLPVVPGSNEEGVYPLNSDELLLKIK